MEAKLILKEKAQIKECPCQKKKKKKRCHLVSYRCYYFQETEEQLNFTPDDSYTSL